MLITQHYLFIKHGTTFSYLYGVPCESRIRKTDLYNGGTEWQKEGLIF